MFEKKGNGPFGVNMDNVTDVKEGSTMKAVMSGIGAVLKGVLTALKYVAYGVGIAVGFTVLCVLFFAAIAIVCMPGAAIIFWVAGVPVLASLWLFFLEMVFEALIAGVLFGPLVAGAYGVFYALDRVRY